MSGVLNDCDALLQAAGVRFLIGNGASVNLVASASGFHLNSAGVADLAKVTVTADLIGFDGTVSFSASGGTLTNAAARSVDVNYAGGSAIVTATVAAGGETFTRSLVIPVLRDGAAGTNGSNGTNGTSPNKNGVAFLYKWSTAAPAKPAGTSTFGWSSASNTAYGGSDGWSIAVPNNPGTPLIQLFVASIAVTDVAVATSTTVSYASSIVAAWAQNGANGTNGSNGANGVTGVQSGEAKVYQWAATIPAGPVGSPSYAWSTSTFGAAPANWTLTPGAAPSPGMTLWMARVGITDSAAASTTSFNWTAASILAVGYAGSNGSNGSNGADGDDGAEGVSYVTAYCASATASTSTAPANTTGKTSVPAVNGGGITGTWSKTVPALTSGQFMYQSDGLYNPATNQVVWSIPYWSSLKVGTLSAITANLGAITGGSLDIGSGATSWHVDTAGNQWAGSGSYAAAPFKVSNTGALMATSASIKGAVMGGGYTGWSVPAGGQTGFYLGPEGLALGNSGTTGYFEVSANGNVSSPQFTITSGAATFSGALSAATGTFKGDVMGGAYTTWGSPANGGIGYILSAQNGIAVGNYASGRYVILNSNGNIEAPGFNLISGQLTLTAPVIVNPNISGANLNTFTVGNTGAINSPSGAANAERNVGSRGVTVSGSYNGSLAYAWSVASTESANGLFYTVRLGPTDGPSVNVYVKAGNDRIYATISCTVTDGNGVSRVTSFGVIATFGTGPS